VYSLMARQPVGICSSPGGKATNHSHKSAAMIVAKPGLEPILASCLPGGTGAKLTAQKSGLEKACCW
jgi:hypothetical protein